MCNDIEKLWYNLIVILYRLFLSFSGPSRPQELKLPSEIFYASNNCTQPSQLNAVRIKFQSSLQMVIRTQAACETSPGDCIVEDVIATCQRHPDAPLSLPPGVIEGRSSNRGGRRSPQSRQQRGRSQRNLRNSHAVSSTSRRTGSSNNNNNNNDNNSEYILPVQFHFGTRVPASGGTWPDEYHKASHRLFAMFDFFERHVVDGAFSIRHQVTGLNLSPMQDSLTFAPALAICDISYKFNTDILLCGK